MYSISLRRRKRSINPTEPATPWQQTYEGQNLRALKGSSQLILVDGKVYLPKSAQQKCGDSMFQYEFEVLEDAINMREFDECSPFERAGSIFAKVSFRG